jgi:2TM domain
VVIVPAEMLTKNDRGAQDALPSREDDLRYWARRHVERVRRVKLHIAAFLLGMCVLTPVWALVEWNDHGGFQSWGNDGMPGEWEPWILYVALIWGLIVGIVALKTYFDRPATEGEIEREIRRLSPGTGGKQ